MGFLSGVILGRKPIEFISGLSDAEGVGAPALDAFLDLLAVEVLFEGHFCKLYDFVVGGKTESDQLILIEAINLSVPFGGSECLETQTLLEADDAILDLDRVTAQFSDEDESCQGENYQPFGEDIEIFYGEAENDDEVDDQDGK